MPWKRGVTLPPNPKIVLIPISDTDSSKYGMMDDWQAMFLERRLRQAQREKADLIILELDTHGGSLLACEKMIADVAACKVPVIAYVKTHALSAGALLALGCKMIVMEPASALGSAKVINSMGDFDTAMRQKEDGYMRALVSGLCDRNGYPHAIAKGMVDSNIEVIETNDSKRRFMTDSEFEIAKKGGTTSVRVWKQKDQILSLSAQDALNTGVAQGLAANTQELLLGLGVPGATVIRQDITSSEVVARFLSNPLWSVAFVIVALLALFLEMKSPGHGVGYAAFAFCMGVFFWLQFFSNNSGLIEVCLFGIGALLVAVELFILPTFGALGFAGVAMVIVSIVLAYLPEDALPGLLGMSGTLTDFTKHRLIGGMQFASLSLLAIIAFMALVWWRGIKVPGFGRLELSAVNAGTIGSECGLEHAPAASRDVVDNRPRHPAAGRTGVAETNLRPSGKMRLDGRTFDAVSEGDFIEAGSAVEVLGAIGEVLRVRRASPA